MPSAVGLIIAPCKSAVFPLLEHESSVYVHTKWNWKCFHVHSDTNKTTVNSSDDIMSKDQRLLRIILENHIMKNKVVLGQLYNGQHLETIGGKRLRVFIYRTVCPLSVSA